MQTYKKLIKKLLYVAIASAMVTSMLPTNVLASDETGENTIQNVETENNQADENEKEQTNLTEINQELNDGVDTKKDTLSTPPPHDIGTTSLNINNEFDGCDINNPHIITGNTNTNTISVTTGIHYIKLSGMNITISLNLNDDKSAFSISPDATVYLTLTDKTTNTITSGRSHAGLEVPAEATLSIDGTGELIANGGYEGAGIGGGNVQNGGNIIITDGIVTANSLSAGAGIGGGQSGDGGNITITGGIVTANSLSAAGIGGGFQATGGVITISNGIINANGGTFAAGIGGSHIDTGGIITITGGTVIATGGHNADGIGSGLYENHISKGADITITNGANVTATSRLKGQAINDIDNILSPSLGSSQTAANIMQFDFDKPMGVYTNIQIKDNSGDDLTPVLSHVLNKYYNSISMTVPDVGDYTVYRENRQLSYKESNKHLTSFTASPGLKKYTIQSDYVFSQNLNILTPIPVIGAEILDGTNDSSSDSVSGPKITWSTNYGNSWDTAAGNFLSDTIYQSKYVYTTNSNRIFANPYPEEKIIVKNLGTGSKTVNVSDDGKTLTIIVTWPVLIDESHQHSFGDWIIDKPATETENGTKHRECTICKHVETKDIPMILPPPTPTPSPSPNPSPSIPSKKIDIIGEGKDTGRNVDVTTTKVPNEVKEVIDNKHIIGTIKVKVEDEPVVVKINFNKKITAKEVYILLPNPDTNELELLTKSMIDEDGHTEFVTDSKDKMTIVTQLNTGFINTVATNEKPSVTYYVDENHKFKKGWLYGETTGWNFMDYKTAIQQKDRWVADGKDENGLAKWYCLDPNGKMYTSTWVYDEVADRRYYVDAEGLYIRDLY